jgi:hypothetical protein
MDMRTIENGMVSSRPRLADEILADRNAERAWEEAEEKLLSDMDTYQGWLASHCANVPVKHTQFRYIHRDSAKLQSVIDTLDVPQLLAMTQRSDRRDAQLMALDALQAKYLAENTRHLREMADEVLL